MSERSMGLKPVVRSMVACVLAAGTAQQALAQVTYTVDRSVGAGRITGTIRTNGNLGVLTAADILDWNLAVDADGNGTSALLVGPPSGPPPGPPGPPGPLPGIPTLSLSGSALSATPTGLFFDFSSPGFNLFQIQVPDGSVMWQLLAGMPGMTNELIREAHGVQVIFDRTGLEQIATTVIAPLEITADTTLDADRRGPIVIAADNVTLDCAYQTVVGSAKDIGIHAAGRTGVTITRCVVFNFGEGIVLEDSSDSVLAQNTASENVSFGIRLTGADRNRLTGNYVTYTRGPSRLANGLVLESSSKNRLEFNTVDHSDVDGVRMDAGSRFNAVVANVSSFNGGRGFNLAGASSNTVLRNTAIHNRDFGFLAQDQAMRNRLIENAACHNRAGDATEIRDSRRSNGNVWALNLFCSPSF